MTGLGDRLRTPGFTGRVGIARRDVTPPVGIRARNWGPADWNVSAGNHRSMTLTAVAIDDAGGALVIIAVDGTWWRRVDDEWRVRGAILDGLGLSPERLLFSLSHTHAGPVLCAADAGLEGGELIPAYLDHLAAAGIDAGREALASATSARLDWAVGRCALAGDRELDVDGRALVGHNPGVVADDTVLVGRLSAGDEVIGTIVNYACHPTTLAWQNELVSPDYVGAMRQLVEDATGAPCAFLQGASGELAPRQQYTGDAAVADRHGASLGHAVLAALAGLPPLGTELELTGIVESGAPLAMWEPVVAHSSSGVAARTDVVELELAPLKSLDELAAEWAEIDARSREERLGRARNLRDGYIDGPTVQHPVWAWRLGDGIVVAHPGEAYSRLQSTLRSRFPEVPITVANLTNGPGFVYLPTRDAYDRGAYQAWQTPLAPGSLERLEAHACALVAELLAAPTQPESVPCPSSPEEPA